MAKIGRFVIIEKLGEGGMGVVYRAQDPELNREVALKTVRSPEGQDEQERKELVRCLKKEAQAAALMQHEHIVRIFDIFPFEDATCVVMEYVEGKDLAKTVDSVPQYPLESALCVLRQCAEALDYAHGKRVVHRDIKPSNIMVNEAGSVKITDFGIAKILNASATQTLRPRRGTFEFMSPEHLEGGPTDGATDQYSLAVVGYRLLTGHTLYNVREFHQWLYKVHNEEPTPPSLRNPSLPLAVDVVLARALAKKAVDRYKSCRQFVEELEQALTAPRSTLLREETTETITHPTKKKFKFPSWAMVLCAAVMLAGAAFLVMSNFSKHPVTPTGHPAEAHSGAPATGLASNSPNMDPLSANPSLAKPGAGDKEPSSSGKAETPAGPLSAPPAGTSRVNPKDGLRYVWIPPGTFTMGCSPGDSECYPDEKPEHDVTLTKGFWMGQTEVTQQAFQRVMEKNPSHFQGASLPVDTVTWDEANAFCKAVVGRLPTEAEWEYGARGGDGSSRYGELSDISWFERNSGNMTHEVAKKRPNGYGLYDMLGNLWEWVEDWYELYKPGRKSDPPGPPTGRERTLRGGAWGGDPRDARASSRIQKKPQYKGYGIGFRCVGE